MQFSLGVGLCFSDRVGPPCSNFFNGMLFVAVD